MEETQRQKKIGGIIQQDLVDVLQRAATSGGINGILISVTKVKVTTDLSVAKAYISVFPNDKGKDILKEVRDHSPSIRHELAQRTRHQLRRMPSLEFFIDDSLEYIDRIESSLKGKEDPIKDADLLEKRKKS